MLFFSFFVALWITFLAACFLPSVLPNPALSIPPLLEKTIVCYRMSLALFLISPLFSFLNINLPFLGTFRLFSAKLCGWGQENLQICLFFGNSLKKANLLLGKSPEMLSNFFSVVSIWRTTGTLSLPSCSLYHSLRTTASFLLLRPFLATTLATLAFKVQTFKTSTTQNTPVNFCSPPPPPRKCHLAQKKKKTQNKTKQNWPKLLSTDLLGSVNYGFLKFTSI